MHRPNLLLNITTLDAFEKIDTAFCQFLQDRNFRGYQTYLELRQRNQPVRNTKILLDLSPYLESFICEYLKDFENQGVEEEKNIAWVKKFFIQKRILPHLDVNKNLPEDLSPVLLLQQYIKQDITQFTVASHIKMWLDSPEKHTQALKTARHFCAWALNAEAGQTFSRGWSLFHLPEKVRYEALLETKESKSEGEIVASVVKPRVGFDLTDEGPSKVTALDETFYCLYCHEREKDSCSTGKYIPKTDVLESNPLEYALEGCPLNQKISEMNLLASQGHFIAAVAMAMIDNPLMIATGHRICQDCSKACIFQKQTPVDIPAIETFLITNLLKKPWGFEVYYLLSRWNPLNIERPLPKPATGKKVCIVGMGPAGFTLAHHLLMEGHTVMAFDGMKIEALPEPFKKNPNEPIEYIYQHFSPLSQRQPSGFGGVMEFGITPRWNKNFLLPIQLMLKRWGDRFSLYDSVRFGSTISAPQLFDSGVDHIALCVGAGKPRIPNLPNALANGGKLASDFLMALQTNGATREDSLLPLTLDLPCVVVGGGLTAVDAATEASAYYPLQVKKVATSYRQLKEKLGYEVLTSFLQQKLTETEQARLQLWLEHERQIRAEDDLAAEEKRVPNYLPLISKWGGVHILYRGALQKAPSYRLNHPELQSALNEGVIFWENTEIETVHVGMEAQIESISVRYKGNSARKWPVKSLVWALGIEPATDVEKNKTFGLTTLSSISWPSNDREFIIHESKAGHSISCFGDIHPYYNGSVVRAMASAKNGYPSITKAMKSLDTQPVRKIKDEAGFYSATLFENKELSPGFHELIIHAPAAIQQFQPGQIYRVQPYASASRYINGRQLIGEGVALSAVKADQEKQQLHFISWTTGTSTYLLNHLKEKTSLSLMGPTGCASHIQSGEKVLLIAGQLGLAIGKKLRQVGAKVVYFASFYAEKFPLSASDFLGAGDYIVTCSPNQNPPFFENQSNVLCVKGYTVDGLEAYADQKDVPIPYEDFDRVLVIGSSRFLQNFYHKFYQAKNQVFKSNCQWEMAVTTPMQCMMKGVCGQCVQRHTDGSFVFSCAQQDQNIKTVDMSFMKARLEANKIQETLYYHWIKCFGTC